MSECKHTYWRYTVSSFIDKNKNLHRKESIKPLKRPSCNESCQPSNIPCDESFIHETLDQFLYDSEQLPDIQGDAKDGDTLILKYKWYDCDHGYDLWFEVCSNEKT